MALKSGRVGVDRSQVDAHGKIIGGSSDSYTKQQADNKFATKSSLTANSKQFMFAYDEATQKYGYKAGGADTFHPFSSADALLDWLVANEMLIHLHTNDVITIKRYDGDGYWTIPDDNIFAVRAHYASYPTEAFLALITLNETSIDNIVKSGAQYAIQQTDKRRTSIEDDVITCVGTGGGTVSDNYINFNSNGNIIEWRNKGTLANCLATRSVNDAKIDNSMSLLYHIIKNNLI